ncbi:hypothetical protein MB901379_04676 [Mycobacterium basiliense]|uniref:Uncharacterized protein n=1 Tax=Mycobacterium basiliense TaxID=2094119 RepID=A0A3S4FUN3_9MYCO|nr:hypothetical protein MB901379_04676 [Mycobacterium basiliense]
MPQSKLANPIFNVIAPRVAGLAFSGGFGAMYFPGVKSLVQGDTSFQDGEVPGANGVVTGRGLAKMYAALANDGHLGYHESPVPGLLNGFGHVGLGGTLGWADPETASSFGYVHNRLLTPLLFDMGSFAGLVRPLRNAIRAARRHGFFEVPEFGANYPKPARQQVVSEHAAVGDG